VAGACARRAVRPRHPRSIGSPQPRHALHRRAGNANPAPYSHLDAHCFAYTSTATPLLVYADPYLPCLKDSYDDLISLMGQIEEALSDEIVLCNLVPAALDDMFEIRINHATCPEPADPTLSLLEFAFATALQSGDSYLRNMDDYCEDSNPWSLQMATDDLEDMAHWIREATIQLANYASQ